MSYYSNININEIAIQWSADQGDMHLSQEYQDGRGPDIIGGSEAAICQFPLNVPQHMQLQTLNCRYANKTCSNH